MRGSMPKNVSITAHRGPEQLQAKKETCRGRSTNSSLCVRERLCTATMGRGGSHSTYHTVGWACTNGEALLMERMSTALVSRDGRLVKIYIKPCCLSLFHHPFSLD